MNLIQQAVERAGQMERENKLVAPPLRPAPSLGNFTGPHSRAFRPPGLGASRLPLAAVGFALLAILGGAALYAALVRSSQGDTPRTSVAAAAAAPKVAPPAAVIAAAPAAVPAVPVLAAPTVAPVTAVARATPADSTLEDAKSMVEDWARAWSERDVVGYLSYYGSAFAPERGASRATWEKSRRQMLERRRSITVTVKDLRLEPASANRVVARYTQDYLADSYREMGTPKRLVLEREGGGWRIVSETADKPGAPP